MKFFKIKFIFIISFTIVIFFGFGVWVYKKNTEKNILFRCEGEIVIEKSISNKKTATLHADANYIFFTDNKGLISLDGSIDNHRFNRQITFSFKGSINDPNFIVNNSQTEIKSVDNTPKELSFYFYPKAENYIFSISNISGNLYLISNSNKPVLLCNSY